MPEPLVLGFFLLVIAILVGLLIYWLFFLTEGVYLGEWVVVKLYDLYARRYDGIKEWQIEDEIDYLAVPFVAEVGQHRLPPLILDVAAGTGRLARAVRAGDLLPSARWVLLDASGRMLRVAMEHLGDDPRIHYLQYSALTLPFDDDVFDVVTCLEALEFMPQPEAALAELTRVLRPGGLLVTTNRIGAIAKMMPGKTWSHQQVYRLHKSLGLHHIAIRPFLVDYEWVSSTKAGSYRPPGRADDERLVAYLETLANIDYN